MILKRSTGLAAKVTDDVERDNYRRWAQFSISKNRSAMRTCGSSLPYGLITTVTRIRCWITLDTNQYKS